MSRLQGVRMIQWAALYFAVPAISGACDNRIGLSDLRAVAGTRPGHSMLCTD